MKQKKTAAILAILLGSVGAHKFYLGDSKVGCFYLAFSWTGIPGILGIVDGVKYLQASDKEFEEKFVVKK